VKIFIVTDGDYRISIRGAYDSLEKAKNDNNTFVGQEWRNNDNGWDNSLNGDCQINICEYDLQ
jgi:hypothetical protein